ncbi:hypothetical protein V7182_24265 [Neobacillus drentensis]|uniref:hypothetical protein n=1 Tax=Neobacillus drentensis TaxID=220684 RepID=UPI002FFEE565
MKKEDLLTLITNSDGNVKISSISTAEECEDLIHLAKTLESEGKIVLVEYCMEQEPLSVSLKTKETT